MPREDARSITVNVRLSAADSAAIKKAAAAEDRSVSYFVARAAREAARAVLTAKGKS